MHTDSLRGGVEINDRCKTNIKGLYVAGEASGGVHGRNRLTAHYEGTLQKTPL